MNDASFEILAYQIIPEFEIFLQRQIDSWKYSYT